MVDDGPFDRDEELRQEQDARREFEDHRQARVDRLAEQGSVSESVAVRWLAEREESRSAS